MFRIDQCEVLPAAIDGSCDNAFLASSFVLKKSSWISDEDANFCAICNNRFNQFRRRHHCRCCGKVLCNKCCTEKVPLPQYGLDNPERVCNACTPVASSVTMSYSTDPAFHLRAVTDLSSLCRDSPSSVVALGGAHVLISLSKKVTSTQTKSLVHIASGLHSLSRHECLTVWLSCLGVFHAIVRVLNLCNEIPDQSSSMITTDCLGALRILVKSNSKLQALAFEVGCFPVLLRLCDNNNAGVSLIATSTLCHLAECPANHSTFTAQQGSLRDLFIKVTKTVDEQVKEHVLRIMVILSTGNDDVKHIIASEDATSGGVLASSLQSRPHNKQIIASAASTIANLATNERDQMLLQSSMRAVLVEIKCSGHPQYVTVELIRAAANFARHAAHSSTMITYLRNFVQLLNFPGSVINFHAVRCIFNLLQHRNKETISLLCQSGVEDFLLRFTELDDVMCQVIKSLSLAAPPITS